MARRNLLFLQEHGYMRGLRGFIWNSTPSLVWNPVPESPDSPYLPSMYLSFPRHIPPEEFQSIIIWGQVYQASKKAWHLGRQVSCLGVCSALLCRLLVEFLPTWSWCFVFIKRLENLEILFLFDESWFIFSSMCSEILVLVFPYTYSLLLFSILFSFLSYYFPNYFNFSVTFSLSSLLCIYHWWDTQMFFLVLLTCIVGPEVTIRYRCLMGKTQILESDESLSKSSLCLLLAA